MPELRLRLLGPPLPQRDDQELHVGRRKALALLAYLALQRRRYSREALAAFLWPEYDQSGARGRLRRTLSSLNRILGGGFRAGAAAKRDMIQYSNPTFHLL
jgi:DNA-binding SARP family transcriptional activator